ncbi:hypothetical protein QYE76_017517 [Lolium multiflorum]|uniref:RNase H type-1 domain-containing protein n=1 Tax=Lolium multiflorum TaxID=4521 RepID=A0AAD8QFJ5_LOLMU|nr:hypothetical protein QYE76_017517 [Lolium multiflorum]
MYVVGVPFRCRCIFPLVVAKSKDKGVVVAHKAPSGESESQSVSSYNQAAILDAIQPKVTDDMNSDLMAPYSDEEINELHDEVTTPELAEALALRRALSLAGDEGFGRIMVVSDCLSLIQRVNSSTMDRSSVGVVVQDIKALASHFEVSSFTHVYRTSERDAGHAQDRRPWQRRRAVELAVADLNLARRCLQPRHAQAAAPLLPSPPRSAPSRAPPRQFPPASTSAPASSAPAVPARVDLRPGELRPGSPRPHRPPPLGALPARVDVRPGELCPPASTSARPRRPPASGAARGEARDGGQRRRPEARPPALASWRGAVRHGTAARGGGSRRGQRRSRLGGAR